jgi:D-mannonate dehydratase
MLFEMRKENVMLNDEYNKIVSDRTRYEVEYERMKKRLDELENIDENENVESLDAFIESVENALVRVDVFMTTIINIVTSKKLSDSFIFTEDKDSNIEN